MNKVFYVFISLLLALCLVQGQGQVATSAQNTNDINALNYALTLENLEAAFYAEGQAAFNVTSFTQAGLPASAYSYLSLIGAHENAHVSLLTSVLGNNAVAACKYNFTYAFSSVYAYIATARLLEETGVSAYDGAANTINNADLLQTAATIATIEARHASYLNQLLSYVAVFNSTGQSLLNITGTNVTYPYSPFPLSFDAAIAPANILTAAAGFLVSCPSTPVLPTIAYTITPYNFTNINASVFNSSGQYLTQAQFNNDNYVLNFSLTLELLGRAFYSAVASFTPAQFAAAGYNSAVWNNFQMIIAHELAHVAFLNNTLIARGATPAQPCTYNIGNYTADVPSALAFARMLENLEVTAYDGAINSLTQYDLIQGAATIATVEARHGNYLNSIVNGTAGVQTSAVDATNTPANIIAITAPYFGAGCVTPTIPTPAYLLQAQYLAAQVGSISGSATPSATSPSTTNTPTASGNYSSSSFTSSPSYTPSYINYTGASSRMSSFLSWLL